MTNAVNPHPTARFIAPCYIGLPMWSDPGWPKAWFGDSRSRQRPLHHYANQLNSVEGNTTFYALPGENTVARWNNETGPDFRFTFKFHQAISHRPGGLTNHDDIQAQLALLHPLAEKTGCLMLQLPATFGPQALPALEVFLSQLPRTFHYAVEVRHPAFFDKDTHEIALNRLLIRYEVNRVIMDTRALFTGPSDSALTAEVREKKPRVPVHAIATGNQPIVRFVAGNDNAANEHCMTPWLARCHAWREEGKTPFLFFHKPDNHLAPWLADRFIERYNALYPDVALPRLSFIAESQGNLF